MKKIVFRVDSGFHMGIGHVMRCLTLAAELKNSFDIHFICKDHPGANLEIIKKDFYLHIIPGQLKSPISEEEKMNYANWLGSTQEDDAHETNLILSKLTSVDMLVIDHYSIDESYEKLIKANKIFVIDDLMNRNHFCDLLLDQNISANEIRYKNLVNVRCQKLLIGPKFSMLRSEFNHEHKIVDLKKFEREIQHIVVFFGAADVKNDTLKFMKAVLPKFASLYSFSFIVSQNHPDFEECQSMAKQYPRCQFMSFSNNFLELMKSADLFIGAGGTTSWERACLGVASALLMVAHNQKMVCEKLALEKMCYYLGDSDEMTPEKWVHFFQMNVPVTSLWNEFRSNSYALVDGLGAQRVKTVMEEVLNVGS